MLGIVQHVFNVLHLGHFLRCLFFAVAPYVVVVASFVPVIVAPQLLLVHLPHRALRDVLSAARVPCRRYWSPLVYGSVFRAPVARLVVGVEVLRPSFCMVGVAAALTIH